MTDRMNAEIDRLNHLSGWDIFDRRDGHERGGYKFVIPGVMLGADDVQVDFDRVDKVWVLSYSSDGGTWTGRGEDLTAAYLDLIADRCGLHETEEHTDG